MRRASSFSGRRERVREGDGGGEGRTEHVAAVLVVGAVPATRLDVVAAAEVVDAEVVRVLAQRLEVAAHLERVAAPLQLSEALPKRVIE